MFDEADKVKSHDMVELLEELTLSTEPPSSGTQDLHNERLAVDLHGKARPADRSRCSDDGLVAVHLVRVSPREFTLELASPLAVGDHYVLSFDPDELDFESADHSMMRCTACAERPDSGSYRAVMRPFVDIGLRRVLSGKQRSP